MQSSGELVTVYQLTKKPPGSNSKLTPDRAQIICEMLAAGNYLTTAAEAAGVARNAIYEWMEKGEADPDSAYGEFLQLVRLAEAAGEAANVKVIREASHDSKQWTAAAWLLERKYPDRWGKRDRITVGGDGQPIEIQFSFVNKAVLPDEEDND